jgi:hypothetical protein
MEFHELDVVKLKQDRPDIGVSKDFEGTIVDVLGGGEAFTIEFFDEDNDTIMESLWVEFRPDEIEMVESFPAMKPPASA